VYVRWGGEGGGGERIKSRLRPLLRPLRHVWVLSHGIKSIPCTISTHTGLKLHPHSTPSGVSKEEESGRLSLSLASGEVHPDFDVVLMVRFKID
jgi:hypothetical protein